MDGRCKDCTLDEKLQRLQVLRLLSRTPREGCEIAGKDCTFSGVMPVGSSGRSATSPMEES